MRAAGIKRAQTLVEAAQNSVGLEAGEAARLEIWVLVNDYILKAEQLKRLDEYLEEKVKEVLKKYIEADNQILEERDAFVTYPELIDELQEAIEQDEKENGWIPVSERLPKKCEDVLTSVKFTGCLGRYGTFKKIGHIDYYGKWSGDCSGGEVIAWMPLPEPYKED